MITYVFDDFDPSYIHPLSLHDALPIYLRHPRRGGGHARAASPRRAGRARRSMSGGNGMRRAQVRDRKSTRLNSSHLVISYAVFCLKKKIKGDPKVTIVLISGS